MPPSAPRGSLIHLLITDSQVIGILTWVGLCVTIAGFWIAIVQIRKVRTSAQAATEAVSRLAKVVRSQEQNAKVSDAIGHLTSAHAMMKRNNTEAAAAYLSVGWSALIAARELSDEASDRLVISEFILSTRQVLDDINAPVTGRFSSSKLLAQRHAAISGALGGLGILSARLHATLSGIGLSS